MQLPAMLSAALSEETSKYNLSEMKVALAELTEKYMSDVRSGDSILTSDIEAIAYANCRMTATYGANYQAIDYALKYINDVPRTLIDVGAGTGAATWAASELIEFREILCLEKEEAMFKLGSKLTSLGDDTLKTARWEKFDVTRDHLSKKAEMIIASYMINELDEKERGKVITELYNNAEKILVIVEPGTKAGFKNIKMARETLKELGANIVAPCPDIENCPTSYDDWCHFTCRMARGKVHKYLKDADVPYEDEKFSYIVVSKEKTKKCDLRVLRHPKIETGRVTITACTKDGIEEKTYYKKDELFKKVKKSNCGDDI